MSEVRDAFRATFFSGWAIVLAAAFLIYPIMWSIMLLRVSEIPSEDAVATAATMAGPGSGAFFSAVLVAFAATGAWARPHRPMVALAGRIGAVVAVLALAWALPIFLLAWGRVGAAALLPVVYGFGVEALKVASWVTFVSLAAHLFPRHAGIAAGAVWVAVNGVGEVLMPMLVSFFDPRSIDEGRLWMMMLSPATVWEALRGLVFPRNFFGGLRPIDGPSWFTLPVVGTIALLWLAIPAALHAALRPGAQAAHDEAID